MRRAHVVILTAITLEYEAVLEVSAGAWPESKWESKTMPQQPAGAGNMAGVTQSMRAFA